MKVFNPKPKKGETRSRDFIVDDGAHQFKLPDPKNFPKMTFIFSTNAANIDITITTHRGEETTIKISKEDLDEEGRVSFRSSKTQQDLWDDFVQQHVRKEVRIRFVQT
jgi:hypothetical protein